MIKRLLIAGAIGFVIYFAFSRPGPTADLVKEVIAFFPWAADRLATFVTEVLS